MAPNRRAVLIALGASFGVVGAEAAGILSGAVVVAVLLAAGGTAAFSIRSAATAPYAQPYSARPLPEMDGRAVITAPTASQLVAVPTPKTDAA